MSEITDLQAKFDASAAAVQKAFVDAAAKLDELAAKLAALGGAPSPAELAAFEADVSAVSDQLSASAAAMETKVGG